MVANSSMGPRSTLGRFNIEVKLNGAWVPLSEVVRYSSDNWRVCEKRARRIAADRAREVGASAWRVVPA